ncbi:hypothetical protein [Geomesophilobacter sediminis]|uniref:Uncharacterized protein n=1 Tax=Geomesophilobacter sediminis TaxID=2798584 RepID=A0A8J7JM52_9BACT|nr:hypothetical protein [Geomesophilobacter sediminis]MBJ6725670.1 hypothetical protein [Geomesophilobacter sediminis]
MQGYELIKKIDTDRREHPERMFIKWWRNEEDFIDFDLVTRFMDGYAYGTEISGFELIGMDEMWRAVESRSKGKATRTKSGDDWVVRWTPPEGAEDVDFKTEYPYTPETLLKVLDAETGDNYVD